jgi:hypothetical protein
MPAIAIPAPNDPQSATSRIIRKSSHLIRCMTANALDFREFGECGTLDA